MLIKSFTNVHTKCHRTASEFKSPVYHTLKNQPVTRVLILQYPIKNAYIMANAFAIPMPNPANPAKAAADATPAIIGVMSEIQHILKYITGVIS